MMLGAAGTMMLGAAGTMMLGAAGTTTLSLFGNKDQSTSNGIYPIAGATMRGP